MTLPIPSEMDSLPPPPPYTPRDDLTPSPSAEPLPTSRNHPFEQLEHANDNDNGPSHDYSAYEQVLPETDPNPTEPDEPLPAYHPGSYRSNVDRRIHIPAVALASAVPHASRHPAIPTAWTARAPSCPANLVQEPLRSAPSGVSALQRAIDLTRQLSERSADQVARSVRLGFTPRCDRQRRPGPVRITSSSSSSSLDDPLSVPDHRDLDNLDLTSLRTSIANLMRDPANQDEVLQAVSQLRDDLNNRRDFAVPKQQVRDFKAEVLANRKKVRAMREEAKAAKKAEDKQSRREKRAEKRATKRGLSTESGDGVWISPA